MADERSDNAKELLYKYVYPGRRVKKPKWVLFTCPHGLPIVPTQPRAAMTTRPQPVRDIAGCTSAGRPFESTACGIAGARPARRTRRRPTRFARVAAGAPGKTWQPWSGTVSPRRSRSRQEAGAARKSP
jgi:hypothetical protein